MKNLANCKPTEFIAQTAKIKGAVKNWMDVTKIMSIRRQLPEYDQAPENATAEERAEIIKRNAAKKQAQAVENLSQILDQMLIEHPQETLNVLALCCFVEPDRVDDHTIDEYMDCILELVQSKSVVNFFTLLAQLNQKKNGQKG